MRSPTAIGWNFVASALFSEETGPLASPQPSDRGSVDVEEKWVPFFKTGKELRERLNASK